MTLNRERYQVLFQALLLTFNPNSYSGKNWYHNAGFSRKIQRLIGNF